MKEMKNNLEKIDYSIMNTIERHPTWNKEQIVLALLYEENYLNFITSKANSKEIISSVSREDIIKEIAKQALKVAVSDNKFGHLPGKPECIRFLERLKYDKVPKDRIVEYLEENTALLTDIAKSFSKIRYKNRKSIDLIGLDKTSPLYVKEYLYYLSESNKKRKNNKINSLNINEKIINKCREDICRGIQIKKDNVDYSLGKTMYASSNIGKNRQRQEDSVLLLRHPKNNRFKILVVADGVGGYYGGAEASKYVVQSIIYWFEALSEKYYNDIKQLSKNLDKQLESLNDQIFSFGDGRGTTFVSAIVGKTQTLISSIGDSRAYIIKNNELIQVSRDDSLVQNYYEKGYIKNKDDMRFHHASNRVTQCIGMPNTGNFKPNMYFLSNDEYDKIILMSDGVSDCLSDSQIMKISTEASREDIAKLLVDTALITNSTRPKKANDEYYFEQIPAGKDNTTAAIYSKK